MTASTDSNISSAASTKRDAGAQTPSEMVSYRGGYPLFFLKAIETRIAETANNQHGMLIMISIKNLPMIISGYGHETCEASIQSLHDALDGELSSQNIDFTCTRLQKEQIGIILRLPETSDHIAIMQSLNQHMQDFCFMSDYGAVHLLLGAYDILIADDQKTADDLINQSYLTRTHIAETVLPITDPTTSREEMNMVHHIHRTLQSGRFCMAFQPIIDTKNGAIARYEALLRVRGDDGKLTTAGPLIPLAERMGLIDIIDEMVLDLVAKELVDSPELKLSFNVSNLTANSPQWLQKFTDIAMSHPEIISRMMVEITETAVHLDLRRTAYFVATLQSHGASVALDDFGSGYTSFRQLKSLSMDIIKIDGIFVRDLPHNQDNRLFIKTMLDFTRGFGLKTVAEFVENGETAKILMELGVDYMQGYYFGFPDVKHI